MPSSRSARVALALAVALLALAPSPARAQQPTPPANGFGVERFYASSPGGGWWVMDALDMHGGLGADGALTLGYAGNPLRVSEGAQQLAVVSDQAFAQFAAALTWRRFRFSLAFEVPLAIRGQNGSVGGQLFQAPVVDLASRPDTLADPRFGVDVRLLGAPGARFRLGGSAQLYVPNGARADYVSDGTWRAMLRALVAGDVGRFVYAGQLGVHIRPLDDGGVTESPRGSELVFGVAGGARIAIRRHKLAVIIGPELFGATALRSFFGATTTAFEGLLSGRIEGTRDEAVQWRARLGIGAGLHPHFGAPEWRLVVGIELFHHNAAAPR